MKMKKTCELCKGLAKTHCESDQASLCWSCDFKVHSANFLVARHSRTLLCRICQSPTPWTASGLKIGPTVSVCVTCVQNCNKINDNIETEARNGDEEMESTDSFDDEDDEDEDLEYDSGEETDCEDNQVVPWSPSTPPPTSPANSSSDEEESSSPFSLSSPCNQREAQRKRTREDSDRCYNVNYVSRPSQENADAPPPMETVEVLEAAAKDDSSAADGGAVDSVDSLSTMAENSLKKRRIQTGQSEISESRAWVIVESIKKLQQEEGTVSSEAIAQLRRLSEEDPSAIDNDSSDST